MRLNNKFCLTKSSDKLYLADVECGDVYMINNIVESIITLCEQYDDSKSLASVVYEKYRSTEGDCSLSELIDYIERMIKDGIILC